MTIKTEIRGHVGIIRMDRPPVNAINQDIRAGLIAALVALAEKASLDRIVLAGADRIFAAGADAGEFKTTSSLRMQDAQKGSNSKGSN